MAINWKDIPTIRGNKWVFTPTSKMLSDNGLTITRKLTLPTSDKPVVIEVVYDKDYVKQWLRNQLIKSLDISWDDLIDLIKPEFEEYQAEQEILQEQELLKKLELERLQYGSK